MQPMHVPNDVNSPWAMVWGTTLNAGAATINLTLPDGIVLTETLTVLPKPAVYARPAEFMLQQTALRAPVGGAVVSSVNYLPIDGKPGTATPIVTDWASTDPSVASVLTLLDDLTALPQEQQDQIRNILAGQNAGPLCVKGLKAGKATITVLVMGAGGDGSLAGIEYLTFDVIVSDNPGDVPVQTSDTSFADLMKRLQDAADKFNEWMQQFQPVLDEGLAVDPTSATIDIGQRFMIGAAFTPGNASNKCCSWSSSNPKIATVDSYGFVVGVAPGTVTITATTKDGTNISATCVITVRPTLITKITLPFAKHDRYGRRQLHAQGQRHACERF